MRKKLKDTGGLTFVELLCAAAILVLLCLMMNTGLSMALKNYRDVTAESEAQLLLSDLSDALADKLRYCVVGEKEDGAPQRWTLITEKKEIANSDGEVCAVTIDAGRITVDGKDLLPDGAYGASDGAYIGRYTVKKVDASTPLVTCEIPAEGGIPSFKVKFIVEDKKGTTRTAEFTVRCLSPVKKEV